MITEAAIKAATSSFKYAIDEPTMTNIACTK
jgi:hypothetical protein